jgi:hypothetical protein
MTKVQQVKDSVHNFLWWTGIVAKVLMFQAAVVLMVLGIFYISNFKVTISPIVQTVSPIVEEVK